ncbi:MAG TPA: histidine phosphatase family protein [Baekduia sp.]|nr:histidine phosphatase family protein [Baekduia sp.]
MIALARHGETDYNHAGRFQGHLPVSLNATGQVQAQTLARLAAQRPWAALWASSLQRARETADIVAAAVELTPRLDARLAETDCGDWTDRPFEEVRAEDPDGFAAYQRADAGFRFPGGESFAEQQARVAAAITEIRAQELPALVICHRGVIRLALVSATGDEAQREAEVPNGALVELA